MNQNKPQKDELGSEESYALSQVKKIIKKKTLTSSNVCFKSSLLLSPPNPRGIQRRSVEKQPKAEVKQRRLSLSGLKHVTVALCFYFSLL